MKKIFVTLFMTLLLFGCDVDAGRAERVRISGEIVKQSYDLEPFDALVIAGPVHLILDQDGGSRAEVESYESMMELFRVRVTDGTLYLYVVDTTAGNDAAVEGEFGDIGSKALLSGSRIKWPKNRKVLNVHLSFSRIENMQIIGECDIETVQPFRGEELELDVAGALHMDAELVLETFNVELAGAGNLELRGSSDRFKLECAGAGNVRAYDFMVKDISIDVAGACNAQVYALEGLDVNMAGLGSVKYKGSPSRTNFEKAGIGKIRQVEDEDTEL